MRKTLFVILSALVLFACKKDKKETVACTTSATTIAGSYKITSITYKQSSSSPEIDYLTVILSESCQRDDVLTFNSGGTYVNTDAGTTCSPSSNDNGTWALSGSNMIIDGDATAIDSFDCKTLVLVNTDIQTSGDRLKITLTRQ